MDSAAYAASGSQGSVSSPSATALPVVHVRATDIHQHANPYSAYESNYRMRHVAAHSSHVDASVSGAHSSDNGTAAETSGLQHSGTMQPPEEALSVSAEVSALTAPENESQLNEPAQPALQEVTPAPGAAVTSAPAIHPVLHLIAHQALQEQKEGEVDGEETERRNAEEHGKPSSSDAFVEEKLLHLTERLNEAEAQLAVAMAEKEAAEQVWSPSYSRLKTSRMYVTELKSRVQSAASLYLLQRYERETLQQAHVGVAMESMSLQLVLRDVRARLEDEPGSSLAGGDQQATENQRLVQQLRAVLSAPAAASQSNAARSRQS
ncbi:hypothetical protein Q4I30_006853 [Leishmania utingensis]|uniref:Uncharacterized protein n=1 Tax=Leishmania utingensis TaxID=653362 RepID=A0AAW3A0Z6_9TRYP